MNIKYFEGTDTLYVELQPGCATESRDFDEYTVLDLDADGRLCAFTVENAELRACMPNISYEHVKGVSEESHGTIPRC